jgi:predicted ATPase with chaperone activity
MELAVKERAAARGVSFLPEPRTVEETGLDYGFILDLCLKTIYEIGRPSARVICERICLPFNLMEDVLEFLRRQEYVDIVGSTGITEQDYQYALTSKGQDRAQEILERGQYVGPAPVPFELYKQVVARQSITSIAATPESLAEAFERLVLHPETVQQLGTAVGSGRSVFIYGPPGNGKSTVAECLITLLSDRILIPYAFEVSGQVVRVYDPRVHLGNEVAEGALRDDSISREREDRDLRWAVCRRPLIIGGGEMTLKDLELSYSPLNRFYVAPSQVKANNGVLVVDDFGRQLVRPEEMLNRWMIPMDRNIDHLTLQSGETITVPFDVLLIFATNLQPSQLGDEAFFRRIRHKIRIGDPDESMFKEILRKVASGKGIPYDEDAAGYLIKTQYKQTGRPFRGVHPRDLFDLIDDMAKYSRVNPVFNREWVDRACRSYFIED